MSGPLVACPACAAHVLTAEASCPHCGAEVRDGRGRVIGRTAGAVLMGLALSGCPADDSGETMGSSAGSTSSTMPTSTTDDSGTTSTSFDPSTGPFGEAYGSPDTGLSEPPSSSTSDSSGTDGGTDTDTDTEGTSGGTDSGSTSLGPDYGVPTTGGPEPLYGALDSGK